MRKSYTIDRAWFTDEAPKASFQNDMLVQLKRQATRLLARIW